MQKPMTTITALSISCLFWCANGFAEAGRALKDWRLPQGTAVKDAGPRTYRFTVDYFNADQQGVTVLRQHLSGVYTRGLPGNSVEWNDVAQSQAQGAAVELSTAEPRLFMKGFRYRNDLGETVKPDFFAAFPPMAVAEKNLVWDTGMIEMFGQNYFAKLELNTPLHLDSIHEVNLPGLGVFNNKDIVLEWVGLSRRNRQDCAVIEYHAYLNPIALSNPAMTLAARSEYWGSIWVALSTKQIEYATLNEIVNGELKLGTNGEPQSINVFRSGVFEPIATQ